MGSLFTTSNGEAIKQVPSGDVQIDFLHGTVTDSAGTVTTMNTNLDYYGLTQCQSFACFTSDSDTGINIGNALTISDHQLTHVVNNYAYDSVRLSIPSNSTPDASNQIMFIGSTDAYLGYIFNNYAHDRDQESGTTTDAYVTYVSHHVGGYDQVLYTIANTHGSNSLDVQVEYSENGTNWYQMSGYSPTGVTVTFGSYNSFSTDQQHHFYRVRLKATAAGNQADFTIFWNYVSANN